MSDYARQKDFSAKDALASGNAGKIIVGQDFDEEFDAILTAVNSKYDATDLDTVLVPLDTVNSGSLLINASYLPDATTAAEGVVELATIAETITGTDAARCVTPDGLEGALAAYTNAIASSGAVTLTGTVTLPATTTVNGGTPWTDANDGAGSTLDADLLDGQEGSYYRNSSNQNAGTLPDGRLSSNVPLKDGVNAFTAGNYTSVNNPSTSTTTTIDWDASNAHNVSLTQNTTLATTNESNGQCVIVRLQQDATGGRTVAFPGAWKWPGGTVPTVSSAANAIDILTLYSAGSTIYATMQQDFS